MKRGIQIAYNTPVFLELKKLEFKKTRRPLAKLKTKKYQKSVLFSK